jgi:hypothetical protein
LSSPVAVSADPPSARTTSDRCSTITVAGDVESTVAENAQTRA